MLDFQAAVSDNDILPQHFLQVTDMNRWMTCDFMSFSTAFNPFALRKAKIGLNFALSECYNRVKSYPDDKERLCAMKPHL